MSVSPKQNPENENGAEEVGKLQDARKRAQRLILLEHLCNTLADRMWLYAAGLLLIDTIAKLDENSSSIVTASLYGVVLASVKILFAPLIGSLIESSRRLHGAMTSLIFQNTTVALSCLTMFWIIYSENVDISAWAVFAIVTAFSCFAILASVGLQNAISRDWVVEITTPEELTTMNAWMRSIDQATMVLSTALSGFSISLNQAWGAVAVASFNILAMIIQAICLVKTYNLIPALSQKKTKKEPDDSDEMKIVDKIKEALKTFFGGWALLFTSKVAIPGLALATLYVNILGLSFPLQGYGRENCLSEATISIIYIGSAVSGFLAPISFPFLKRTIGLLGTACAGAIWQLIFVGLGIYGLFTKGSPYFLANEKECIDDLVTDEEVFSSYWLRCPAGVNMPESFVSIIVIFSAAVAQRWGLWIFDMSVTQMFQEKVDADKRNRTSAGHYSLCSVFEFLMYGLALAWGSSCLFGNAILVSSGLVVSGYAMFLIWAFLTSRKKTDQFNFTEF
ncbi:unnamed protein product [Oikopleura dioica]|uniref:Solute carrier family 40 member n=1 Tax=Oikopleura dioica TaxID=34765 RepID=E4YYV9_OIKDI|nr:unnamed protein product [Oikopleura dioica]